MIIIIIIAMPGKFRAGGASEEESRKMLASRLRGRRNDTGRIRGKILADEEE